jgi:hypothetical protein
MALRDPVAVYNAANNAELYLVQNALADSGIEAFVTEDNSQVGTWALGLIPELHKPQVWVERSDVESATSILVAFEKRQAELQPAAGGSGEDILVACEECDKQSSFPGVQRGSVQQCPHCGGFIDVGEAESAGEWESAVEEDLEEL